MLGQLPDTRSFSTAAQSTLMNATTRRVDSLDSQDRSLTVRCSSTAAAAATTSSSAPAGPPADAGFFARLKWRLSREAIIAPDGFNRWRSVPSAFVVQLSIGSVYAWSIFNAPLTRDLGVVAQAADDWALTSVVPVFSTCAVTLGICTFSLGPWAERSGPRMVAVAGAVAWSGGLLLTGLGVMTHQLPLLYLGYGALGGIGWGLGYISPVSTLMKWFPDRRGMATGLALTAFGGGAMLATPINEFLLSTFFEMPTYLGTADSVQLVTDLGKRFAQVGGELKEVVVATAHDVANLPVKAEPGVYVVGTGSSGAAKTFFSLGVGYFTAMCIGASMQRVPRDGWAPPGYTPPKESDDKSLVATGSVHHNTALRTPQFYLLFGAVAGNATAGVTTIACAKTLMIDIFSNALPAVVTGSFAATYVAALSGANMLGRLGWANLSDYIGRKTAYFCFGMGIPLLIATPYLTNTVISNPSVLPLIAFYGGSFLLVTCYGGVFSVLPAYIADLFGPKHCGAIHGRLLTAWSAAAISGPLILTFLRYRSYDIALKDLASKVDPSRFQEQFGAPVSELQSLAEAKTVNIHNLLTLLPPGTPDPSPALYNDALYTMAGVLCLAAVCNAFIKPVSKKFYIQDNKGPEVVKATVVESSKGK